MESSTKNNSWAIATHAHIKHYLDSGQCQQLCGTKPFGSRHWEYPWAIEHSGISGQKGLRILDIAPDFTFPYATFLEANHHLTFIDLEKRKWSDSITWGADVSDLATRSDLRIMDVRDMSFGDNTFDVIFCISVLEHIVCPTQDPDHPQLARIFDPHGARPALREMIRCLKPGGKLLVTVDVYQGRCWKQLFDRWDIKKDLAICGVALTPDCMLNADLLMRIPDVFLSDFHGPYFTLGFALTK
ncbi:MAG: class I SAM-dependent methyltransferase [Thermodesulfobacteriota bacterium]